MQPEKDSSLDEKLDILYRFVQHEDRKIFHDMWKLNYKLVTTDTKPKNGIEEIAVLATKKLTNSCIVSTNFIRKFGELYRHMIALSDVSDLDELESLIMDTEFVDVNDRVEKHLTFIGKILNDYVARAEKYEYIIDQNGYLSRNQVYLDSWLDSEKDFTQLKEFYRDSIKETLPKGGSVVFINRDKSPKGPILIKDYIESELQDYGIIVVEEDLHLNIEKEVANPDYCILYDTLLNGEITDTFAEEIKHILLPSSNFKGNVAIFNEKKIILGYFFHAPIYSSEHYDKDSETISYITAQAHIDLLGRYPKAYTGKKRTSTWSEAIVSGFVGTLTFGDDKLADKAEGYVQKGLGKIRNTIYEKTNNQ